MLVVIDVSMDGLLVTVSNTPGPSSRMCSMEHLSFNDGEIKSVYCDEAIEGRYVRLALKGTNKILYICEVEIYGTPGKSEWSNSRAHFCTILYENRNYVH